MGAEQDSECPVGWHYDRERDRFVSPPLRVTITSASLTAGEFGDLLWSLEELWAACSAAAGEDNSNRLVLVDLGTGSFWARFRAECRRNPLAAFAAFATIVQAVPDFPDKPETAVIGQLEDAKKVYSNVKKLVEDSDGKIAYQLEIPLTALVPAKDSASMSDLELSKARAQRLRLHAAGKKFKL